MLAKKGLRGIKSRDAYPFDANRGTLLQEIEHSGSDSRAASGVREIDGFCDDIVGGHQSSTRSKQSLDRGSRGRVMRVLPVDERI